MNCIFCGKLLKPNGKSHESFCYNNPERKSSAGKNNPMFGKKGANQYTYGFKMTAATKDKVSKNSTGRKLSPNAKKKISESMKKAHLEGKAWNIGKSRWNNKESYPESFFRRVIENEFEDKNYCQEHPIGIYSGDFAWPHKKMVIEIDGEQHERFDDYKNRDIRKDEFLIKNGWRILRLKWKDVFNNTKEEIEKAKKFIGA